MIFEWKPKFVVDRKGNCAIYRYKHEESLGFKIVYFIVETKKKMVIYCILKFILHLGNQ